MLWLQPLTDANPWCLRMCQELQMRCQLNVCNVPLSVAVMQVVEMGDLLVVPRRRQALGDGLVLVDANR